MRTPAVTSGGHQKRITLRDKASIPDLALLNLATINPPTATVSA